jgi:hypothetical protein
MSTNKGYKSTLLPEQGQYPTSKPGHAAPHLECSMSEIREQGYGVYLPYLYLSAVASPRFISSRGLTIPLVTLTFYLGTCLTWTLVGS